MKVIVIGGTGHVGTYLVPRLVSLGHEVIQISRGNRQPYQPHGAWKQVQSVVLDRQDEEAKGTFGARIAELAPEVVIDMTCFTMESALQLVEALKGKVTHFLHCGTIWVHGPSVNVPTTEDQPRAPFGAYGERKAEIEAYLLHEARLSGFPATILHPGHIVGPGWEPVNPAGHWNTNVFSAIKRGQTITLPNLGMETLHHVHADDVAQSFVKAMNHWSTSVGESFHVVSPQAVTMRGFAAEVARWFGQDLKVEFLPWEDWKKTVSADEARSTWDHIAHSPNCSIEKAKHLIGYNPHYSTFQAVKESVDWLDAQGRL